MAVFQAWIVHGTFHIRPKTEPKTQAHNIMMPREARVSIFLSINTHHSQGWCRWPTSRRAARTARCRRSRPSGGKWWLKLAPRHNFVDGTPQCGREQEIPALKTRVAIKIVVVEEANALSLYRCAQAKCCQRVGGTRNSNLVNSAKRPTLQKLIIDEFYQFIV